MLPYRSSSTKRRIWAWTTVGAGVLLAAVLGLYLIIAKLPARVLTRRLSAVGLRAAYSGIVFGPPAGLTVHDLIVWPSADAIPNNPVLRVGTLRLRLGLLGLVGLGPEVVQVEAEDVDLHLVHDPLQGRWNISNLRSPIAGRRRQRLPQVKVSGGRIAYLRIGPNGPEPIAQATIQGTITTRHNRDGYQLDVMASTDGQRVEVVGSLDAKAVSLICRLGQASGLTPDDGTMGLELWCGNGSDYNLQLWAKSLVADQFWQSWVTTLIRPVFAGSANPIDRLARFLERFQPAGKINNLDLRVTGSLARMDISSYQGVLDCNGISILDRFFPYKLDGLTGQITFGPDGFQARRLVARHGDVELTIGFWTEASGSGGSYQVEILCPDMPLDQDLYNALRPAIQRLWSAFELDGHVALRYLVSRQPQGPEQYSLLVRPNNLYFMYKGFPYPLHQLKGQMVFEQDQVRFYDLVARGASGGQVHIAGTASLKDPNSPGIDITINALDVPLDNVLGKALSGGAAGVYASLEPNGLVDANIAVRRDPGEQRPRVSASLNIKDASARLLAGKAILYRANGQAELEDDLFVVKHIAGVFGDGRVVVKGRTSLADKPDAYSEWSINGYGVDLNDLAIASPGTIGRYLSALNPSGRVDMSAQLRFCGLGEPCDLKATIHCLNDRIELKDLACPIEGICGKVEVDGPQILLRQLRFRLGDDANIAHNATVALDGNLQIGNGRVLGGTIGLLASDLVLSQGLIDRLGRYLSRDIGLFSATGLVRQAHGIIHIGTGPDSADLEIHGSTDLDELKIQLGRIELVVSGQVQTTIAMDQASGLRSGVVLLNNGAVQVAGKRANDLRIRLEYDPVERQWFTEQLTGRFYEGLLTGSCWIGTRPASVELELAATGCSLGQFTHDRNDTGRSTGSMDAWLCLTGALSRQADLIGRCTVNVKDMQVGRTSVFSKLLDILRLREPSDYMFQRMEVDSYIRQQQVLIERFDMAGKSAAFQGSGVVDISKDDVQLILLARGTKRLASAEPPALQALTEGLGGAVVRIEITGRTADPQIKAKTLPVLQEPFRIFGAIR